MSATAATRRPSKKTYKPFIRIVNRAAGLYTVQSERYTHLLYLCDVLNRTCECEAGQHDFANCGSRPGGVCKHLRAATAFHAAIERSRQAPIVPAVSVASPALVTRYGGAAGLMEAFGIAS